MSGLLKISLRGGRGALGSWGRRVGCGVSRAWSLELAGGSAWNLGTIPGKKGRGQSVGLRWLHHDSFRMPPKKSINGTANPLFQFFFSDWRNYPWLLVIRHFIFHDRAVKTLTIN